MQKYLPSALSFDGMAPVSPGTFQTLLQQKPWYSRYGGDLFLFSVYGSDTLGTSQMGTAGIRATAHILGQRHYELTNHLGNVQATVLDRVTPQFVKGPSGQDVLTGYSADISTAQDYYPFGMLMPGRYISDTSRHCVTTTQTVMVQKPIQMYPYPGEPVRTWLFGGSPTPPRIGTLPVAQAFDQETLHVYHYLDASEHPDGWVAHATAAGGGLDGLNYSIDLSGEPSGISSYLHLHLDTAMRDQSFSFELGRLPRDVVAEVRVRQYAQSGTEQYEDAVGWKRVGDGVTGLSVPVNKWAVAAGGKTVAEWRFSERSGRSFVSGTVVSIRRPWLGRTVWVAENRVVRTCEEKDNYRFGFNGMEKDNEAKGLGNSLDFGARMYDSRLGKWMSLDPAAGKFPWQSPYAGMDNNPILKNDPTGKSGEVTINKEAKTLTVTSNMVFYGECATPELSTQMASDIQKQWNAANGKATIEGVEYCVQFVVTGESRNVSASEISENTDIKNNYIKVVESGIPVSYMDTYGDDGGNTGEFLFSNVVNESSTTEPHEFGHGLGAVKTVDGGYEGHPGESNLLGQDGAPGIFYPRGTAVEASYTYDPSAGATKVVPGSRTNTMNPETRKVNQKDVDYLHLEDVKFDGSGKGQLGTVTNTVH